MADKSADGFLSAPERNPVPGVGVEPTERTPKEAETGKDGQESKSRNPRSAPLNSVQPGEDVAKVVLAWAKLPESVRAAILALVEASKGGGL